MNTILKILAAIIFLFVLATWLTGCSIVHKIFHKEVRKVDSTGHTIEKKDSTVLYDSSTFHKEQNNVVSKVDSSNTKDNTVITEDITEKHFDTSGKLKKEVNTHRVIENNKVSQSVSSVNLDNHSMIDSNELKKAAQLEQSKDQSTQVKLIEKQVDKKKDKSTLEWWWFLLLIPAFFIAKNWKNIKSFLVHFATGL